jgi:hypothetical protein
LILSVIFTLSHYIVKKIMKFKFLLSLLVFVGAEKMAAQPVSINPPFATANDNGVVITYDASQGSAGLLGENTIYAHTGVITSASTSGSDWRYVLTNWTTNLPKALLTRVGTSNRYTLNIGNIKAYYGIPSGETVLRLAFVFRNTDGTKTGKTAAGGDILIDINQGIFQAKVNSPQKGSFFNLSDSFTVSATSSAPANLILYANGTQVAQVTGASSLTYKNTLMIAAISCQD